MGMTHGEPDTFPRTGDMIGFCTPDQVVDVCEKVVTIQRDWGNRSDRKHARLKYTIEARGLETFRAELNQRGLAMRLPPARPIPRSNAPATAGLASKAKTGAGTSFLFVENGRVHGAMLHALRAIAETHDGRFILTPNQNLVIADVAARTTARRSTRCCDAARPASSRACCGAMPWPAWRCRPAAWRWPRASATCRS